MTKQTSRKVIGIEGDGVEVRRQAQVTISPWYSSEQCITDEFWVIPREIDWALMTPQVDVKPVEAAFNTPLADPNYWKSAKVELLLGARFFAQILVCSAPQKIDQLVAIETSFGTVVFGLESARIGGERVIAHVNTYREEEDIDKLVRQLWAMDKIDATESRTSEEQAVEDNFTQTVTRDEDGRFIVTIPMKPDIHDIGDSRAIALRRFFFLERRLCREPELREKYIEFMREYEALGHMIKATESAHEGQLTYYIPHHCVTRKFRVVFDCSCKTDKGISLNDVQQLGEKLQRDLFEIVTRFRRHKIAFSADVKMMFRQVRIARHQWDLQRIFWRESPSARLHEYWLTVVTYGMTSSAYNAVRALVQCARDAKALFPDVERVIVNDFYMDDCVTGCDSKQEAMNMALKLDRVLRTAGFELRKWKSNSPCVVNQFESAIEEDMIFEEKDQTTVLGLKWLIREDKFTFVVKSPEVPEKLTKRKVLSYLAQLYDPNGYISPVVILGKIIVQDIWRIGLEWDQEVPEHIERRWRVIWEEIQYLEQFKIERWLGTSNDTQVQLHGFSDASSMAYGAVIYARIKCASGEIRSNLVVSKTRVAPLKNVTIPRLELAAAELLGRLLQDLLRAMDWASAEYVLWTDSTVVLHWLKKSPRDLKTFVANRVSSIQTNTNVQRWRHVGTTENPADLLSRGLRPTQIINNDLWLYGPTWLNEHERNWPMNPIDAEVSSIVKSEMHALVSIPVRKGLNIWVPSRNEGVPIEEYASSLEKLVNILARVIHFKNELKSRIRERKLGNKRRRIERRNEPMGQMNLSANEKAQGMIYLIKKAQSEFYGKELASLHNDKQLPDGSSIESLKPVIDNDGVLRVGGRLHRAEEKYEMRHPAIIPQGSRLAWLLIDHAHRTTRHGASQIMMQFIRQQYWIPRLRSTLRSYMHKCVICARYNYRLEQQLMSDLPADRVRMGKPFLHTGVDYAGPFVVKIVGKDGRKICSKKAWVGIFVCLKTRAIHIELIDDLTSLSFLACYERFISRRGHCERMYSDNGTSFIGGARILKQAWREWERDDVFGSLGLRGTEWIFMIPAAPHQGGIYEAAVKSMKYHLKRIVGQRTLKQNQFLTLLTSIEGILNSRPIHPLSDDPNDTQALTPGHFLIGEPVVLPPRFTTGEESKSRGAKLFRERQIMMEHFWKRWREEYLVTLQERKKWRREKESLKIGQLVIIKNENFPPAFWCMGRICELIKSKDGIVRSVVLRTENGQLTRPVQKICVLPIEQHEAAHT